MSKVIFRPAFENGVWCAYNVADGTRATDGLIRDIMLSKAFENDQLLSFDTDKKNARRIEKEASRKMVQDAGKESYRDIVIEKRDPQVMFNNLERLTKMVGRGIQPSLVITGDAGMGKTYLVKDTLTKMGMKESEEFVHLKGRATCAGLFITLYENEDKIIVLDDCDSVFKDDDAVNLLKAALDSYDVRRLSYLSSKPLKDSYDQAIPRHFEFRGKVIFISNLSQDKLDEAIRSRSFVADISMNIDQMFQRMEQLKESMEPSIPIAAKDEAIAIMRQLATEYRGVEINLRSFIKAARICTMGFENSFDMVAEQIINPE